MRWLSYICYDALILHTPKFPYGLHLHVQGDFWRFYDDADCTGLQFYFILVVLELTQSDENLCERLCWSVKLIGLEWLQSEGKLKPLGHSAAQGYFCIFLCDIKCFRKHSKILCVGFGC